MPTSTEQRRAVPGTLRKNVVTDQQRQEAFAKLRREREEYERTRPAIEAAGLEALKRLVEIAHRDSGQCRRVAAFLLGLYNGTRFKFDLTDFRALDRAIFHDCMAVLAMDFRPQQEVHTYFPNGSEIWEKLAKDWNIRDYTQPSKANELS